MEQTEIPGLLVATPPRRHDRSRSSDKLIVLFTLPGDLLASATRQELQQHLVATYFRTRGTVTSALRAAINDLNNSLLKRNLRAREGAMQGRLNVAVLRRDMLTLAHVGSTQSFLLNESEAQRLNEADNGGVGLGVSRTFSLRFSQARIQPGDMLVMTSNPPAAWTAAALAGVTAQPIDQARARLLALCGGDVEAVVAVFQPGEGTAGEARSQAAAAAAVPRRRRRTPVPAPKSARKAEPEGTLDEPGPAPLSMESESIPPEYPTETQEPAFNVEPEALAPYHEIAAETPLADRPEAVYLSGAPDKSQAEELPEPPPARPAAQRHRHSERAPVRSPVVRLPRFDLRARLATLWRAGRRTGRRVDRGGKAIAGRLMPGSPQSQQLSPALMLFIALAVPVMVVAIAATIYLYAPSGRSEQQQTYLDQATQYAAQAGTDTNEVLKRNSWGQVLYWLDEADRYGKSDELIALRSQAQNALDALSGITRVEMQPVFNGIFDTSLHFTHIVASPTDVYLLEAGQGRIMHLTMAGDGYAFDSAFQCGPGLISEVQMGNEQANQVQVGKLVELILLPPSNALQANVMGIDVTGKVIYCKVGGAPQGATLTAPDPDWGTIDSMIADQGLLYVLDKQNNRIWVYVGTDYKFPDAPRLYFDNTVPTLGDVASIAVNNEDMYLLHEQGQMTTCTFRQYSGDQTRCTDEVPYGDQRPGRGKNDKVTFTDAKFIDMQVTRAPDSSLYMLDANSASIYHFSLRLNLQNQYRADAAAGQTLPSSPPTAFAVTTGRVVLEAFDSQVYYGSVP